MNNNEKSGWSVIGLSFGSLLLIALVVVWHAARTKSQTYSAMTESICVRNLQEIAGAKETWATDHEKHAGEAVSTNALLSYFRSGGLPLCPKRGIYTLGRVGEAPSCSAHPLVTSTQVNRDPNH